MSAPSKPPLADATKKRLKSLILEFRRLLEDDLGRQLKRLGIDPARSTPIPLSNLSYLTEEECAARCALDAVLDREMAARGSYVAAVDALCREAAYTHLNRLVGLKCLELRGHLCIDDEQTEAVTCRPEYGGRSRWLWTLRDRENRYRYGEDAEEHLWREGLTQAYAAVTEEIGVLFDPSDPYAQVWPSHKTLREVIDKLNELPEDAFRADELLGWVYQYFQTEEKDRVFEEARTKKKKISGKDIIAVTQLYTERYMVDFLLQNSIGARWMEMYPDSGARVAWPYYVTPSTPHTRPPKPLKEWTVLDPAVGSGHFLVVAFDLLAQLYDEERKLAEAERIPREWAVPESKVALTILEHNLHGIDIDPRSVQIASLALYLKAKEHGLSRGPRINVIAADASFFSGEAWERFLAGFEREPSVRRVLEALVRSLMHIRELGSLLRPEEELRTIIAEEHKKWEEQVRRGKERQVLFPEIEAPRQQMLPFEKITDEMFWERLAYRTEASIQGFLDKARESGEIVERVVAGEARRGFAFLELLRSRYDVVCTNPPYMGSKNMGPMLKDFVARHYSPGKRDIYASFILRCRELAQEDGHVAMVTQQSWMFLRSFADLRALPEEKCAKVKGGFTGLLREISIETLAHLGPGAFAEISGEVVNIVLLIFRKLAPDPIWKLVALRLESLRENSYPPGKLLCYAVSSIVGPLRFEPVQKDLRALPDAPFAYWLKPSLINLMTSNVRLRSQAVCKQGMSTTDNNRYIRFFWETKDSNRWLPTVKGGGIVKWWGLTYYEVDWESNGARLKADHKAVLRNIDYYGRDGLTYTAVAGGCSALRQMMPGTIPEHKGPCIYPINKSLIYPLCGYLNSRIVSFMLRCLNSGMEFSTNSYELLPVPHSFGPLGYLSEMCISLKKWYTELNLIERNFRDCKYMNEWYTYEFSILTILHSIETIIENETNNVLFLGKQEVYLIFEDTGYPPGQYPIIGGYEAIPKLNVRLYTIQEQLVDYLSLHEHISPSPEEMSRIKDRLRFFYINGPGAKFDDEQERLDNESVETIQEEEIISSFGARIPIPAETFLEELSQKLEIHPISVYWLLEEMRREEGLVCPPELKRHTEDYFCVKLLRMLGHRWPMQNQYEKEEGKPFIDPKWVDEDGIISLTPGMGEETLVERFRRFLDEEFGPERGPSVEIEAGQILGWKRGDEWGKQKPTTLARWFERDFFKRHVSQFKKRPIAWHLTSAKGTFQAIVYYHKFDRNRLTLLHARYVREVLDSLRRKLGEAQAEGLDRQTLAQAADLEGKIADVQDFDERLRGLLEGRGREARIWCPWKKPEEQPVGWNPDINDGVRVNIAPVQRLGLLAAPVLSPKDVKSLLAPEGRD